jgi:hypothetical protein
VVEFGWQAAGTGDRIAGSIAASEFSWEEFMERNAQLNFVMQQGFREVSPAGCGFQYAALMWQPRLTAVIVAIGLIWQVAPLFLVMSAILWWNVVFPRWNPFDALYNALAASPPDRPRLTPAPAPRRFSQGMAASFMLGIGASLLMGWTVAAYVLEAFLVVALSALILGKFCLGSYIFYLVTGQARYANQTLPWARSR